MVANSSYIAIISALIASSEYARLQQAIEYSGQKQRVPLLACGKSGGLSDPKRDLAM